ncbi:Putative carboxymethylenebutenolidase [Geodia barretti]|uniref:Carboxymethylenebutenolidase n=1 Tax=Geodia barretti TaxID=519541 RepID=A0AA35WEN6_GEOBA|nr:Putative carboxymethylenebutenolidase [Geodia barretti]
MACTEPRARTWPPTSATLRLLKATASRPSLSLWEAFGVTRHIEQVCDEYARHGYVAVAPSLYHREHQNAKLGYDQMPQVQQYMGALNDEELIEDINVTIDYLQNRYQRTRGNKIGIVGYCVGGRITYLAATSCPGPQCRLCLLRRPYPRAIRRWPVPR